MRNLKTKILLLAISFFAFANVNAVNHFQKQSVFPETVELKKYQLYIPVQSGVYSDGNCDYWFTATLIYTFDDQTGACTSIGSTSPTLNYSCHGYFEQYARGVQPTFTINSSGFSDLIFSPTGDSKIDAILFNQNFIDLVKRSADENIRR